MGRSFSVGHAAVLAYQLPDNSRCYVAENADLSWSSETWFLRRIDYVLSCLAYAMSKGGDKPRPLDTPSVSKEIEKSLNKTDFAAIAEKLGVNYAD